MDVVVVIAGALALLVAFVVWANADEERPAPMIAVDRRCPMCGHHIREHAPTERRRVRAGCTAAGCPCTEAIGRAYR